MTVITLMLAQAETGDSGSGPSLWTVWVPTGYLLLEWVVRLVLAPIIIRKHSAGEAMAWLALAMFQPIPGGLLYACFGRQLLGRRRVKAADRATELVETQPRIAALHEHAAPIESIDVHHRDLFRLASSVAGTRALAGNAGEIVNGEAFVDRLIEDIRQAKRHVHLLSYIYRDDETGRRVAEALAEAVGRGVDCRVLVDGSGSASFLDSLAPSMRERGIEVRDALPSRFFRRTLARIDVRNHRKLAIIDGTAAYMGSKNLCNADYGSRRFGPWVDLVVRMSGPMAMQLQMLFFEDWVAETGALPQSPHELFPHPRHAGPIVAQALPSGPGRRMEAFRDVILSAINEANERIVMATPYFIPDPPTHLALLLRARAGVRIDLIVPEKTNSVPVGAASKSLLAELLEAGARVHLHRPGLLHVKAITVDEAITIFGSGNFDRRSFRLNYEINLLTHGREATARLRARLEEYMQESRELDVAELRNRPWIQRLADDTAKLISPLL